MSTVGFDTTQVLINGHWRAGASGETASTKSAAAVRAWKAPASRRKTQAARPAANIR